ncbi:DUF6113 family protein [Microbacterium sp. SORGH_AS_0888]|uniref:DUF6113 family protein n=1 Tax=Microbacterium sp. SORGH_AS_0888 TaxID=3041791 RepID=UPI00277E147E|nr:histidinol dehydrogenase [Microbacterium sp. SORGH_AS_0888]MDQ1128175.1 hypothetical protein [Microbacterium sp. SORGH_AS_0888]
MLNRIGAWAVALAVGLVYGAAGSVGQASALWGLPIGLVLSVVGAAALVFALRALTHDRWAALASGLGMMIATWVLSLTSEGGSKLFVASHEVTVNIWMVAVPLVTALVVAWPDLRRIRGQARR